MRLKLTFYNPDSALTKLSCNYNEIIQGFIYNNLDNWLASKVHDEGFRDPKSGRIFKLFTFSRLIPDGKVEIKKGEIIFHGDINLIIASPVNDFIQSFAMNLLKVGSFRLDKQTYMLKSVFVEGLPEYRERILVKTLSPITVYSTVFTSDGRKKTYYYSPFEDEFERLIIENLNKKLRTLTGKSVSEGSIKPYKVNSKNQRIIIFKKTVIKGWDGIFELKVPPELFAIVFDTGVGAKNSQGFGCVEVWDGG